MIFRSLRSTLCGVALALGALTISISAANAQNASPAFVPSEVLVGVQENLDNAATRGKIERIAGVIQGKQDKLKVYRVKLKKGLSVEQAIEQLQGEAGIAYAEPNVTLHAFSTPNDTHYALHQYAPQKVQADLAWPLWAPAIDTVTVIAIVDTGVQMNHPDLVNKIVSGRDIINNDADPSDDNGHGTHCAGIAAAQINNGTGIAGIAGWNPNTSVTDTTHIKIMPIKVLAADGGGTSAGVAEGITHAADNGATVISLSLGGGSTTTLQNAVNYAVNQGCVVVAAAGNSSSSAKSYPAGYSNVISVASTDSTDTLSYFSNYGSWVKVAAPGESIASTYTGDGYVYMSGTSMAAPLVAGEAALLRSHNPALSNTQVEALIVGNTDAYTPYSGRTIGGGRVNVYRALQAATPTVSEPVVQAPAAPSSLAGKAVSRSQINLTWTDNASNEDSYLVERSRDGSSFTVIATLGVNAKSYSDTGLNAFTYYYYRVRAYNAAGYSTYSNTVKVRTPRR